MACGSCGQSYQKSPYLVTSSKGSTIGVIKDKDQIAAIREEQQRALAVQRGEAIPPTLPIPVDGASGPSSETE